MKALPPIKLLGARPMVPPKFMPTENADLQSSGTVGWSSENSFGL